MFNFLQKHLGLVKSKMLRQRRQGGDQEEMGGYYIGEVNEVILFSFFFDNASLFLAVLIIWILIQIRIRLKTLLNKGQQHTQTQKRWRQVLETFIWHAPLYIRFEHKMRYSFRDETFPPVVSVCGGLYLSRMGEICQEGVNQIQQKLDQEREVCYIYHTGWLNFTGPPLKND